MPSKPRGRKSTPYNRHQLKTCPIKENIVPVGEEVLRLAKEVSAVRSAGKEEDYKTWRKFYMILHPATVETSIPSPYYEDATIRTSAATVGTSELHQRSNRNTPLSENDCRLALIEPNTSGSGHGNAAPYPARPFVSAESMSLDYAQPATAMTPRPPGSLSAKRLRGFPLSFLVHAQGATVGPVLLYISVALADSFSLPFETLDETGGVYSQFTSQSYGNFQMGSSSNGFASINNEFTGWGTTIEIWALTGWPSADTQIYAVPTIQQPYENNFHGLGAEDKWPWYDVPAEFNNHAIFENNAELRPDTAFQNDYSFDIVKPCLHPCMTQENMPGPYDFAGAMDLEHSRRVLGLAVP
ncbi:hypothetical protein RUND412_001351 [Rhizina undulata]